MRVLLVSPWCPNKPGGVASQVKILYSWLQTKGYDARVVCGEPSALNLPTFNGRARLVFDHVVAIRNPVLLREALKELRPDIVHVHHVFTPFSALAFALCRKYNIPCIATNHSLPPMGDFNLWAAASYLTPHRWIIRPTRATAVSKTAAHFLEKFFGWRNVSVIPNGVDTQRYAPRSMGDFRGDYVIYIGRLVWRKGVQNLIRAARLLHREEHTTRIVIAGEGYMMEYLKSLASGLRNVVFLGRVDEGLKIELLRGARALVLPSISGESFGVVLIEAFATATPVIATRVGGIPEIVDHGLNGVLVEPGDHAGLADSILKLTQEDGLWRFMSWNARRKALEKYSIDIVGAMYEKMYIEALNYPRENIRMG
ncbi:MAG: glycosyltransferase family 4 protein [Infirmifilum uzonense]|jgi:glycosyltransferase involved in cell wall biosynthesis|uniref:glycosyltransferase family 4 protein n=1 Tax=Infirmifilum TaxID=2856573 RepID=UPI003C756A66